MRELTGKNRGVVRRILIAMPLAVLANLLPNPGNATEPTLDRMPADLETHYALSALPPALRDTASVYLLDPAKGYYPVQKGTSGIACLVQRTVWEMGDFRNDLYFPLCYDAAGTETYLKVIMDAAALRAGGMDAPTLKTEITARFQRKDYAPPQKAGVSYMLGPVMRTVGPPDMAVHTMPMPHVMFYAPFITNADIGAAPDLGKPESLGYPFIDKQGIAEQSYMIQMAGAAEKAAILAAEKPLIDALCAYRDVLCLHHM